MTLLMKKREEAFVAGVRAAAHGDVCPFKRGTDMWCAWLEGFTAWHRQDEEERCEQCHTIGRNTIQREYWTPTGRRVHKCCAACAKQFTKQYYPLGLYC